MEIFSSAPKITSCGVTNLPESSFTDFYFGSNFKGGEYLIDTAYIGKVIPGIATYF